MSELDVIDRSQAAALLGVSDTTLSRLKLPSCPWGRGLYLRGTIEMFKAAELDRQIAQMNAEPQTTSVIHSVSTAPGAGRLRITKAPS